MGGGGLLCETVGCSDLLSPYFDNNKFSGVLYTRQHFSNFTSFACRSREVRGPQLELDSYGGTDPLNTCLIFLHRTTDVVDPCLTVVFRQIFCFM